MKILIAIALVLLSVLFWPTCEIVPGQRTVHAGRMMQVCR